MATSLVEAKRPQVKSNLQYVIYLLAIALSISLWFLAIRAPLFLDETDSYWQISAGFSQIWHRQFESLCFPAYTYILWIAAKVFGTTEVALRIPSVLAMLTATYLLYLAARDLFGRETALIAATIYCLQPIIFLSSIMVRPYAFGALATNAAILILLRLRHNSSNWTAALFGLSAALTMYFHLLLAAILPPLVLCFFILKAGDRKACWRQFGVATAAFAVAFLPLIPALRNLLAAPDTHVYEEAPKFSDLLGTIAPGWLPIVFAAAALAALLIQATDRKTRDPNPRIESWKIVACASLALIPLLLLYGVSVATPLHTFIQRHRMSAVPGIALCWAAAVSRFRPSVARLVFCVGLAGTTALMYLNWPLAGHPWGGWKIALNLVEQKASSDNSPALICSNFPEADYEPMPLASAKTSHLFAQLSYYKLTIPVVPLPRALNDQAIHIGSDFLQQATQKHQRFFAIGEKPSFRTLDWLANQASSNFEVRRLGTFDYVEVLEFTPLAMSEASN